MLKHVSSPPKMHYYTKRSMARKGYEYRGAIKSARGWYLVFYSEKNNPTKPV